MALNVLAYNIKRVMMIVRVGGLLEAMRQAGLCATKSVPT